MSERAGIVIRQLYKAKQGPEQPSVGERGCGRQAEVGGDAAAACSSSDSDECRVRLQDETAGAKAQVKRWS
jgi:hypothetical protein